MLVGVLSLVGRHLNAVLGIGIHVSNHLRLGSGYLVEFVGSILNGFKIPPYVRFAGKWVSDECCQTRLITLPEVPTGAKRFFATRGPALTRRRSVSRRRRARAGLLCKGGSSCED